MLAANGSRTPEAAAKYSGRPEHRKTQAAVRNSWADFKATSRASRPKAILGTDRPKPLSLASHSDSTAGLEADSRATTKRVSLFMPFAQAGALDDCASQLSQNTRVAGMPLYSPPQSARKLALQTDRCRLSADKALAKKHPVRRFAFQTKRVFLPESLLHPTGQDARLKIPGFFDMRNPGNPQQHMLVANARETLYTQVKIDLHGRTAFSVTQRQDRSANSSGSPECRSLRLSSSHTRLKAAASSTQEAPRPLTSPGVGRQNSGSLDQFSASIPQSKRELENIDVQTGFLQQKLAPPLQSPPQKKSKFFVRDLIKYNQLAHLGKKLSKNLSTAFTLNFRKQSLDHSDGR